MKKKIKNLTLEEAAEICRTNSDCFGYCRKECLLKNICGVTKHIRIITYNKKDLEQEIEVKENE